MTAQTDHGGEAYQKSIDKWFAKLEKGLIYKRLHKDHIRKVKAIYYQRHKAEIAEKGKEYRDANRDTIRVNGRLYYQAHKAEIKEKGEAHKAEIKRLRSIGLAQLNKNKG